MFSEERFKHYVWYLVAKFKSQIKQAQNNKDQSHGEKDGIYKMGYLMALYNMIDSMKVFASDFDIEREEIGLGYNMKEVLINFLKNLSYISDGIYQKRLNFKQPKNYEGEFNQLNDLLLDQCEILYALGEFEEKYKALLSNFYCHFEPFFQDYDGMYETDRKESWEEIVEIAKELLEAFDYRPNQSLETEDSETSSLMPVYLTEEEHHYLLESAFLPKMLKKSLKETQDKKYLFEGHPYWMDEIRNLCGIQLQVAGFNENYAPTPEGKILEDLVDKFYIG